MPTRNRLPKLLRALAFSTLCLPLGARAVGLLSDELELYLPWVEFQEQVYSATLSAQAGESLVFGLDEIGARQSSAPPGGLALVSEALDVSVPLINYLGELYGATLSHDGTGGFQVASAAPFASAQGRGEVLSHGQSG